MGSAGLPTTAQGYDCTLAYVIGIGMASGPINKTT
jgi:hypothetical protein